MSTVTVCDPPVAEEGQVPVNQDPIEINSPEDAVRIRYITEHRHLYTAEVLAENISEVPHAKLVKTNTKDPIFDVVKTYRFIPSLDGGKEEALDIFTEPTIFIKIYSPAILKALGSVVEYYPSVLLGSNEVVIEWPYCVLVHHYDALTKYADEREGTDPDKVCVRERFSTIQIRTLLKFLDDNVMEGVKAEKERNARGYFTYEHLWLSHEPGATFITKSRTEKNWKAGIIKSVTGGTFQSPPTAWRVEYWNLRYNGQYVTRVTDHFIWDKFDGENEFDGGAQFILVDPQTLENTENETVRDLIKYGRMYCRLLENQCMFHAGDVLTSPYHNVTGLVMADADTALTYQSVSEYMAMDDLRKEAFRCLCPVCQETKSGVEKSFEPVFGTYHDMEPPREGKPPLSDHQCLLCPQEVTVFFFKTREWLSVHVKNLSDPQFDETMVDNLILDERKKKTLTSLSRSFARMNQAKEEISRPFWSADFVAGKGTGLIFLLHGKPGVGKTLTAECMAAFTQRPLMILTASDIGTNPEQVETNLTHHFKLAQSWRAILLIDEADVFMERRSTNDLLRNSLVAGFLRALEYYEGILFLTTNRVGSFDDAFISRIHVQLYYPDFTEEQRQLVWKTFIKKLERDRRGYMRLDWAAKDYIMKSGMSNLKWNGREIRNAFQTAVSLAEYEGEKDDEGVILLTEEHLRAVVELSKDFKDYLEELHTVDEDRRAEIRYERVGNYKGERK